MFLLGQEGQSRGGNAYYSFLPYRYGPYSFTLAHEIDGLVSNGYIRERQGNWELTALGHRIPLRLSENIAWDANAIIAFYGALQIEDLINRVYGRYPWYTALADDISRRNAAPPDSPVAVYTMGYEGLHVDDFLNRLLEAGMRCIIDVRRNPLSRKYGYHGRTLERLSRLVSIDYLHAPELGIASEQRRHLESETDYDELFCWYSRQLEERLAVPVQRVAEQLAEVPSVLVCQEANPASCHRSVLANRVSTITGYEVVHLGR
jgi:hypothetical protein